MAGRVLDEEARPVPQRWSRSGRRMRPGAIVTSRDNHPAPARSELSRARAARSPTTDGNYDSSPSSPARIPGAIMTMRGGRRTFTSRCSDRASVTRLVTQMYFPNDPLIPLDPVLAVDSGRRGARQRLVSWFDLDRDGAGVGARLSLRHRAAGPPRDAVRGGTLTVRMIADRLANGGSVF